MLDTRTRYKEMKFTVKKTWLAAILSTSHGDTSVNYEGCQYCIKCFALLLGIHSSTLYRAHKKTQNNRAQHGNSGTDKPRQTTLEARAWLRQHAIRSGDFLPHLQAIQLPEFSQTQLFWNYEFCFHHEFKTPRGRTPKTVKSGTFFKLFGDSSLRLTLRKCFKSCKDCDILKEDRKRAPTRAEALEHHKKLLFHNKKQRGERDQYAHHICKSCDYPDVYISIGQDDIDKDKSSLPTVNAKTSGQQKLHNWGVHATGVIVHGPKGFTKVYTWYDEFPHDANVTVECLLRTLEHYRALNGRLPPKLYIQFDNAKNNKCNAIVKLLALLVELGVFEKIKLCFLLVGHTHNDVDQLFSQFTKLLTKFGFEVYTLPDLHRQLKKLENGTVEVEHVDRVLNYTAWVEKLQSKAVKGVSFPALFRFKKCKDPRSGRSVTMMHTRERMRLRKKDDAATYQPECGLKLFDTVDVGNLPLETQEVARKPLDIDHARAGDLVLCWLICTITSTHSPPQFQG